MKEKEREKERGRERGSEIAAVANLVILQFEVNLCWGQQRRHSDTERERERGQGTDTDIC